MFFPRPPRSVTRAKPVAEQVVSQKQTGAVDKHVLLIPPKSAEYPPAPPPGPSKQP